MPCFVAEFDDAMVLCCFCAVTVKNTAAELCEIVGHAGKLLTLLMTWNVCGALQNVIK